MSVWTFLAPHLPIAPVLIPSLAAIILLAIGDSGADVQGGHGGGALRWARRVSFGATLIYLLVCVLLVRAVADGDLLVYRLGDWPAPYGIALVVDRLGGLMLMLTALVALPVVIYASGGWDAHGRHFHPMFQFLLMGLSGAFVTGDLFNLFVFFEVLLISSYVLMLHGQGGARFRAGLHYVVLNLVASSLFLIGVSLLYACTGTLNLADLAIRVPQLTAADAALARSAALLLLVVFGFKAALLPLAAWLPGTYSAAMAPVAALFAIMTKVGVYSILRVHGVVFGEEAGESARLVEPLLLPLGLATCVIGVLGALAANTLPRLVAWLNVTSVGTVLAGVGLFGPAGWTAALYYMANSTLVIAGLFLLAELVSAQRGPASDRLEPASPVAQPVLLGLTMVLAAASAAGLPPLPGFVGKLMLLEAASGHAAQVAIWGVVLGVGLLSLIGLARAGSVLFWAVRTDLPPAGASGASPRLVAATWALLGMTVALSVWAEPMHRYSAAAAAQLQQRDAYARAVLGDRTSTVRPYRFDAGTASPSTPAVSGEPR